MGCRECAQEAAQLELEFAAQGEVFEPQVGVDDAGVMELGDHGDQLVEPHGDLGLGEDGRVGEEGQQKAVGREVLEDVAVGWPEKRRAGLDDVGVDDGR